MDVHGRVCMWGGVGGLMDQTKIECTQIISASYTRFSTKNKVLLLIGNFLSFLIFFFIRDRN